MKDFAAFLRHPPHLELVNRLLATAEVKPMCCALPTFRCDHHEMNPEMLVSSPDDSLSAAPAYSLC